MVVRRSSTRVAAKRVATVPDPVPTVSSGNGSGDQVDVSTNNENQASVSGSVEATKGGDVEQVELKNVDSGSIPMDELPSTSSMSLDNIVIDDSFLAMIPDSVLMDVEASIANEATAAANCQVSALDESASIQQQPNEPKESEIPTVVNPDTDSIEDTSKVNKGNKKTPSKKSNAITPIVTPVTPASSSEATPALNVSTRSRRERKVPIRFIQQMEQELDKPTRKRGQQKQPTEETPKKDVTPKKESKKVATDKKSDKKEVKKSEKMVEKKSEDKKVIVIKNEDQGTVTEAFENKLERSSETESASESGSPVKPLTGGTTTVESGADENLKHLETLSAEVQAVATKEDEQEQKDEDVSKLKNSTSEPVKEVEESSSSEESSDDSDDDDEGGSNDEEDPYKEYCICRKPHANRFMIACDGCEDWFHGSCVNVSRKAAEGIDAWLCSLCRETRPDLAAKIPPLSRSKASTEDDSSENKRRQSGDSDQKKMKEKQRVRTKNSKRSREDESKELTEEEIHEKERLRQLIKKRKREHEEKLRKEVKKNPSLKDPSINKLFAVPEKKERKLPRCSICKKERVKKEGTIYCSFDCIRDHIRIFRKKAIKAMAPKTEAVKKESVEEIKKVEPVVKQEEPIAKQEESVVKKDEPIDKQVEHITKKDDSNDDTKSGLSDVKEEPSADKPSTSLESKSQANDSKSDEKVLEKTLSSDVSEIKAVVSEDSKVATSEENHVVKVESKLSVTDTKTTAAPKIDEKSIELAVYDAFDEKDTNPEKDSKGNDKKKYHGKELLQFIIRHTNFCLDPKLKVVPLKLSLDKVPIEKKNSVETPKTPKTPISRSNSIQSNDSSKNEKKKVTEIQSSRSRKDSESKTPDPKSPTKLNRSNSKSSSSRNISDEDLVKQLRSKAEEMIHSTLKSRISSDPLIENESKNNELKKKLESEAKTLAKDIELQLFTLCSNGSKSDLNESGRKLYNQKSRTLIFNLKDTKNVLLFHSLFPDLISLSNKELKGEHQNGDQKEGPQVPERKMLELIKPHDLVRMSSEELAKGTELDAWRKFEQKKSLEEVIKIEEEKTVIKKTKKGEEEIVTKPGMSDTPTSDLRSKSPPLAIQRSPEKVIVNPLDMIFKGIDSINSRKKVDKISEDVPKSPPRSPNHFTSTDSKFSHRSEKRKRSSTGPKVVTITPSLPSNMVIKESAGGGVQIKVIDDHPTEESKGSSSPNGHISQLNWSGTCTGFEETASSLDPGNSKFPLTISITMNANEEKIVSLMRNEGKSFLPFNQLNVIGRIAPEQVASYVDKLVSLREDSPADPSSFYLNQLVQLIPLELKIDSLNPSYGNEDEVHRDNYTKFIKYLLERKRLAVVEVKNKSSKSSTIKDLYLMPYDPAVDRDQIPAPLNQIKLAPMKADDKEKKLLLVIVRKTPLTSSKSSFSHNPYTSSSNKRSRDSHRAHESRKKHRVTPPDDEGGFTPPRDTGRKSSVNNSGSFTPPRNDNNQRPSSASTSKSNASFDPSFSSNKLPVPDIDEEDDVYDGGEPDEEFIKSYLPGLSPDINDAPKPRNREASKTSTSSLDARISGSSLTDAVLNKILSHNTSSKASYTPPQHGSPSTRGNNRGQPGTVPSDEKELMERARMQMKLLSSNHR